MDGILRSKLEFNLQICKLHTRSTSKWKQTVNKHYKVQTGVTVWTSLRNLHFNFNQTLTQWLYASPIWNKTNLRGTGENKPNTEISSNTARFF